MTDEQIVLEKNIPLPNLKTKPFKYPMKDMKIGDSFTTYGKSGNAVRGCAVNIGIKIITRRISDDKIRVWRIE